MLELDVGLSLPEFEIDACLRVDNEILVLFGPSGAGKTLTIKMIAGLVRPDRGKVSIGGSLLFDADRGLDLPPQRRNVGYIPQRSGVFPHLTALENVTLPLRRGLSRMSKREAEERSLELLGRFGLKERAHAFPAQMSGGELQRVALARVMALQPSILLVDEPFAALDGPVRSELRREFRTFQRELGIPTLFITHDIEEAAVVGDRIAIMVGGEIRQTGAAREILDTPADREVATLVQSGNLFDGTIREHGGETVINTVVGELRLPSGALRTGQRATAVVRPEGVRILRDDRGTDRFSDSTILSAVILEIVDHGAMTTLRAATGEGGRIIVTLSPTAAANLDLRHGKDIRLAIPPRRVHLIPG